MFTTAVTMSSQQNPPSDVDDRVIKVLEDRIAALRRELSRAESIAGKRSREGKGERAAEKERREKERRKSERKSERNSGESGESGESKKESPRWTMRGWLSSLNLLDIIADEIIKMLPPDKTEAQFAKEASEADIERAIADSFSVFRQHIMHSLKKLKSEQHIDATELNNKFLTDGKSFEFKYAGMDVYHGGLEKLIGQPHLDTERHMEWEHISSPYSAVFFENSTNGRSTAAIEYNYVVNFGGVVENADKGRNGYVLDQLWKDSGSAKLIQQAGLQRAEVIALRLYTGPMYLWYNNVLRSIGDSIETLPSWAPGHIRKWKEAGWTGVFTTTLHVLNSAIIKLSRTMKAHRVYRGTTGGILPEKFWTPNDMNVRGGIELGFMSTTLKRKVALNFTSCDADRPSLLFEIQMGMVDRGAPVQWCSQFPGEEEVLFAPLTGQEVVGKPRIESQSGASVLVVELRLNCNLHDLTIEQVTAKMKKTHTDLLHTIKLDMQMFGFSQSLLTPLVEHEEKFAKRSGEWFINANNYKTATDSALQAKLSVLANVLTSKAVTRDAIEKAAELLLAPGDSDALQVGVSTILRDRSGELLGQYGTRLDKLAQEGGVLVRFDQQNQRMKGPLPDSVLSLLGEAEYFNLSGNDFSNIQRGTMLAHMVYSMHNWKNISELNLAWDVQQQGWQEGALSGSNRELLDPKEEVAQPSVEAVEAVEAGSSDDRKTSRSHTVTSQSERLEQFTVLPHALKYCVSLAYLDLTRNALQEVGDCIGSLVLLEKLVLTSNQISTISAQIGELGRLRVLRLDANCLRTLPPTVSKLTSLKELRLNGNMEIGHWGLDLLCSSPPPRLKKLNCSDMWLGKSMLLQIGGQPVVCSHAPWSSGVGFLDKTLVRTVPASAHVDLENASELVGCVAVCARDGNPFAEKVERALKAGAVGMVITNNIAENPDELMHPFEMDDYGAPPEGFKVSVMLISLREGESLPERGVVKASCEICSDVPKSIQNLAQLEHLDLQNNSLETLPETVGSLTRLTSLILEQNELSTLPSSMGALLRLEECFLSRNRLTEVPRWIGQLTALRALKCSANKLAALDSQMVANCSSLTVISLHGNEKLGLKDLQSINFSNTTQLSLIEMSGTQFSTDVQQNGLQCSCQKLPAKCTCFPDLVPQLEGGFWRIDRNADNAYNDFVSWANISKYNNSQKLAGRI